MNITFSIWKKRDWHIISREELENLPGLWDFSGSLTPPVYLPSLGGYYPERLYVKNRHSHCIDNAIRATKDGGKMTAKEGIDWIEEALEWHVAHATDGRFERKLIIV